MKKNLLISSLFISCFLIFTPQSSLARNGYLPKNLFVNLAKKINPTVVSISTSFNQQIQKNYNQDPFFDMLENFLGPQLRNQRPKQGLGTGFIIRRDGLIITNNHVISKANVIHVQLSGSKKSYEARVIGKDKRTDIALIKITTNKKLPVVKLGKSKKLQVGEWVAAFGNPYGHTHSMSKGIVSALGREISELNKFAFIQTDASINPGNSGGPLVNANGEVIGVNTAVDARAQGIGFAIPIDDVKAIIPKLEKNGFLQRGFLGVHLENISGPDAKALGLPTTKGALIAKIYPNTPAKKSKLKVYDFITHLGKKRVLNSLEITRFIANQSAGKKIKIQFIRDGKKKKKNIALGIHPADRNQKRPLPQKKVYSGQKAPFNLGFFVKNYSRRLQQIFNLPNLNQKKPVVIQVKAKSSARKAGLSVGDIILDVNKTPVYNSKGVLKSLRKNQINVLRILRGSRVALLYLDSSDNE